MFGPQAEDGWWPPLSRPAQPREVLRAAVRPSVAALQAAVVAVLEDVRDDPAAADEVAALAQVSTQVELALVERAGDVERSGAWGVDGDLTLGAWTARTTRRTRGQAGDLLRLARSLRDKPAVRQHLAEGRVVVEHAQHVARGLDRLAVLLPEVDDEGRPAADVLAELESALLVAAELADAKALGVEVRRRTAALAPLPHERDQADLHARRSFRFTKDADGSWYGRLSLGTEDGALVQAALEAWRRTDHSRGDGRTATQRDADALVALVRQAVETGALPAQHRVRPHLLVTVTLQDWQAHLQGRQAQPATLLDGEPLTGPALDRLTCDARVTRVVLDPAGLPLDVGRTHRTVPPQVFLAVAARDGGCSVRGCAVGVERCEGHHVEPFSEGGGTSADNTVLLCKGRSGHHGAVHDRGQPLELDDGRWVGPHGWLDPPG